MRTLRVVGLTWCYLVGALIFVSLIAVALRDGIGAVGVILSPFNVANFIVTALALAPGLLCIWAADRIGAASSRRQ